MNIYMNHVRIWRHVVAHWDVALVLEEDIVVLPHSSEVIAQALAALRRDNVTNYVVKLIDHFYMHSAQWKNKRPFFGKCVITTHVFSAHDREQIFKTVQSAMQCRCAFRCAES